jgi:hypothetical protein
VSAVGSGARNIARKPAPGQAPLRSREYFGACNKLRQTPLKCAPGNLPGRSPEEVRRRRETSHAKET